MASEVPAAAGSTGAPSTDAQPITESNQKLTVDEMPKFQLSVLAHVKTSQLMNGLRHNNYQRYRKYCANRLKTLRKKTNFSHSHAKKTGKKKVAYGATKSKKGKDHKGKLPAPCRCPLVHEFALVRFPLATELSTCQMNMNLQ